MATHDGGSRLARTGRPVRSARFWSGHGPQGVGGVLLRLAVAAGLVVDAVVHWQLSPAMALAAPGGVGGDVLFRVQAGAAALAALAVLLTGRRLAYLVGALVAGSALVAVLAYTWFAIPTIGPIPSMYDPVWYSAKTATAVAEGVALVLAVFALASAGPHARRSAAPQSG